MREETPARLLLGIARLGEADLFGWWHARGLTGAGEYGLRRPGLPTVRLHDAHHTVATSCWS